MNVLKSAVMVALCLLPGLGLTANNNKLVIILDASNSMWGQTEGRHKIEIARESLSTLIKTPAVQAEQMTLVTYGSQRKGTCNDIKAFPAGNSDTLLQQVTNINPKGRSPIAAALTQAAELGKRILLISDGQESCGADPCTIARQLKTTHPELQIDVLGFRDDAESQLHCIADNTGGQFALASNAKALTSLLNASSLRSQPETTNIPEIPPDTPGKLELTLGAGDAPEKLSGSFLIYDENDNHITSFTARQEASQIVPPGKYRVDVLWKQMKLSEYLSVYPGQTTKYRFDIGGMGHLTLEAMNNQQQSVNANFTIYTQDGDYLSDFLLKSSINEQLPEGAYRIRAELAGQRLEVDLNVATNKAARHTFVFAPANPK